MDLGLYRRAVKELLDTRAVRYIHLQGWGEPLLHPNFIDMVNEVKDKVNFGLTTNAVMLNERYAAKLISAGVGVVAVTFAGAHPQTHNAIRAGCDFNTVVKNVKTLVETRKRIGGDAKVVASFIALSANIHELPDFIELSHHLGIDEVVIDNLTYIPTRSMYTWKVFADITEQTPRVCQRIINAALKKGKELGVKVFAYSLTSWELAECPERPTETIFINVDGEVAPCVYLNLPTRGSYITRCFAGRCFKMRKVSFGNINSGIAAWEKKEYREFRHRFATRKAQELNWELGIHLTPPDPCITCYRLYGV